MLPHWLQKELYVIAHGQTARFRIVKWILILAILSGLYTWKGWVPVAWAITVAAIVGMSAHVFLRWKTHGWTQSWGKVKAIKTSFDN